MLLPIGTPSVRPGPIRGLNPARLFANGEDGFWYDPSDLSTMWQDSGQTTPVTAADQPVGFIADKSGNGNNATQATAAARPILRESGGIWSLEFDGTDDHMFVAGAPFWDVTPNWSFGASWDLASGSSASIYTEGNTGTATPFAIWGAGTGSFTRFILRGRKDSSAAFSLQGDTTTEAFGQGKIDTVLVDDGGAAPTTPIVDGVKLISPTGYTPAATALNVGTLGALRRTTTSDYIDGHLYQIIVLKRAFTAAEAWNVSRFVRARAGL